MKDFFETALWLIFMYMPEWSLVTVLLILSKIKSKKYKWILITGFLIFWVCVIILFRR